MALIHRLAELRESEERGVLFTGIEGDETGTKVLVLESGEQLAEASHCAVEPGLHRADRDPQLVRDLRLRLALEIGEIHHGPLVGGETINRVVYLTVHPPARTPRLIRLDRGDAPWRVARQDAQPSAVPLPRPQPIDRPVPGDAQQVGHQSRLVLGHRRHVVPETSERLRDHLLCLVPVAKQASGEVEEPGRGGLDQLGGQQKECLMLAYYDGLTQEELAARLAAPLGTVKSWVRRGLLQLKECLER